MIQRFTYLGSVTIEHVKDGDREEWNVNPLAPEEPPSAPELFMEEPQPTLLAAPLELCAVEVPTLKKRTSKGVIRALWTGVFSAGGVGLVYALDNITQLNLSPAIGLAVGAVGYGAKAAIFPNTTL